MNTTLHVNAHRLEASIAELARIGALDGGGVCRLAFGDADKRARDFVEQRMRELGLTVRIDRIGNILGTRPGRRQGPIVAAGSHVDTVATGGRYDGAAGVMAALEIIASLNDAGVETDLPVGVLSFVNEEGARFVPDMMGSLVVRGDLSVEDARRAVDRDGVTVGAAVDRLGYAGADDFSRLDLRAYLELHIEQGPMLERTGRTIGVVEAVQGLTWITYTLTGAAAHAGTTPIDMRRDAGLVAGRVIQFARTLSQEIEGQRATVGAVAFAPNIVNVVAERVRLTVDLRNPDAERLALAERRLAAFVHDAAAAEGVTVSAATDVRVPPARFDADLVARVQTAADALGHSSMRMTSGAGHDAQILSARFPAAMIFVPSHGGVSHNVTEFTSPDDLAAGANVLLQTLVGLAESGH